MKQVRGFYLPDGEEHLGPFLEKGPQYQNGPTYQFHKLEAAMKFCKTKLNAVDVGGHAGLWSRCLVHMFKEVYAFEPVAAHRECFVENLKSAQNWMLFPFALGECEGPISLHTGPSSSGDTYVKAGGEHVATMKTLDSFEIPDLSFLKIDTEGFEFHVLKGGEKTIRRDKPCIIVEQKPGKGKQFGLGDTDAVELLKSWGAVQRQVISGDYILSWD